MTCKTFRGYIGCELFEGTIEEWACRVGGIVTGPNTITIDLNKPAPFSRATAPVGVYVGDGHPEARKK